MTTSIRGIEGYGKLESTPSNQPIFIITKIWSGIATYLSFPCVLLRGQLQKIETTKTILNID